MQLIKDQIKNQTHRHLQPSSREINTIQQKCLVSHFQLQNKSYYGAHSLQKESPRQLISNNNLAVQYYNTLS